MAREVGWQSPPKAAVVAGLWKRERLMSEAVGDTITTTLEGLSHLGRAGREGRTGHSRSRLLSWLLGRYLGNNPRPLSILGVSPCSLKNQGSWGHNRRSKLSFRFVRDPGRPLAFRSDRSALLLCLFPWWEDVGRAAFSKGAPAMSPVPSVPLQCDPTVRP